MLIEFTQWPVHKYKIQTVRFLLWFRPLFWLIVGIILFGQKILFRFNQDLKHVL